uniref:Heteropteran venom family 5 protein 3 n=1 Tax=Oncocephalus sp. TaxID=2944721 RepID=A0AB38ZEP5_9HEMI
MISYKVFRSVVAFILAFVTTSVLTSPTLVNDKIDEIIPHINRHFASKLFDVVQIPDYGYQGSPVYIGVALRNLTTFYRTGDCVVWAEGENVRLRMNLGLRDMKTNVRLVTYMNGPGGFVFEGASAEMGIVMVPEGVDGCRIFWDYVIITTLGNVVGYSFNQQYNGVPPPNQLDGDVIPYYNQRFNGGEIFTIRNLNMFLNLCDLPIVADAFRSFKRRT